ncbi:hypothetical protein [Actinoplanes aureus]|nr:hypothetical protein [Actinoplanes aureus]
MERARTHEDRSRHEPIREWIRRNAPIWTAAVTTARAVWEILGG